MNNIPLGLQRGANGQSIGYALQLDEDMFQLLSMSRDQGMLRAHILLSQLQSGWHKSAIKGGIKGAVTVKPVVDVARDVNDGRALLENAWKIASNQIMNSGPIRKMADAVGMSLPVAMKVARVELFRPELLAEVAPFIGPVVNAAFTGLAAMELKSRMSIVKRIKNLETDLGSGLPAQAMEGFAKYARQERTHAALKVSYNASKTIANTLVTIFLTPAVSTVTIIENVVEAIATFIHNYLASQAFDKATDLARAALQDGKPLTQETLSAVMAGCPFVGALLIGASNYIGQFNMLAMLTDPKRVISSTTLENGLANMAQHQKDACTLFAASHFQVKLRGGDAKEQFGWILKMMEGIASDIPQSNFLTEDAGKRARAKHKMKNAWNHRGVVVSKPTGFAKKNFGRLKNKLS